jgi:hypothetical protein
MKASLSYPGVHDILEESCWISPVTVHQQNYDNIFKRDGVERCFRQIKPTFPILQYYNIPNKIENIPAIIICCVVLLRNIVQFLKDYIFNYPEEELHFEDGLLNRNTSNRKDN